MPALGTRRELTVLRRTAEAMSRCRHGDTEPSYPSAPLGDLRECATKWQVAARASLRATSTLLRNMSSNRFNIRRAVYRTLRALARDQSHFHILIDIERH